LADLDGERVTAGHQLLLDRPATLLVLAAGPRDADLALGGSVARWTGEGSQAHLVCSASGDASGEDAAADPLEVAARCERDQRRAAGRLGYASVTFLHRPQGAVANDLALREQLVRLIRTLRPDAVAAPDPRDAIHPDGGILGADIRATGDAALDALEPARRAMAFPHLVTAEGLPPHAVRRVYLFDSARADSAVDIGASLDTKLAALAEHATLAIVADVPAALVRDDARVAAAPFGLAAAESCVVIHLPD
jgi:LmbE family N-acetylglucosaminyl deacetylase